jgi:hypothetical protein
LRIKRGGRKVELVQKFAKTKHKKKKKKKKKKTPPNKNMNKIKKTQS